jgi:hypothetical protein
MAVPVQPVVPGTVSNATQALVPEAASLADDFMPVQSFADFASPEEVEEVFMSIPDEIRDFRGGDNNDSDPDALCWVTGQTVSICQCDDCQSWRKRRVR